MKFLIIKLSSLGDIVQAVPAVRLLREKGGKKTEIHWLVNSDLADLVSASRAADRVIPFDRSAWKAPSRIFSNLKDFFSAVRLLKKEKYDAALDLQCLFRSSAFAFFAGIPRRIGYARTREGAGLLLSEVAASRGPLHAVEENAGAVRQALSLSGDFAREDLKCEFFLPSEKETNAEALLKSKGFASGRFLLINPNSRWESKKWGAESFLSLCRSLLEKTDLSIGLTGSREERSLMGPFLSLGSRVQSFAGETDLLELVSLIRRARLFITNDSGPMHLASAVETPTLALFGPTSPERTGPYWSSRVLRSGASCSPCFKKVCPLRGESRMQCMRSVKVSDVLAEALRFLQEKPKKK